MDYARIPGPGDQQTWGPCTGHPNDPRTVDITENLDFVDKRDQLTRERVMDLNGWLVESITEASDANLTELAEAIISGDNLRAGDIVSDLVYRYCTPSDDEVREEL